MKRKKSSGGGANWMDTYGDMVTLLLCFFVLLYSMSTISEENWKALVMSFNPSAVPETHATSGDEGPSADPAEGAGMEPGMTQAEIDADIQEMFQALQEYVSQEGIQSNISVTEGDGKVFISFSDTVFFAADSPVLLRDAYPILDDVSAILTDAQESIDEIRVVGHTAQGDPDHPNNVKVDRTLSSTRAANVVIYVQENSELDPARLVSEGRGQHQPVASNDTPEGRAKNRRVEMIISGRNLETELADDITQYET